MDKGFAQMTKADTATAGVRDASAEPAALDLPPMGVPASRRRWVLAGYSPSIAGAIDAELKCGATLARILAARGVAPGAARRYMNPSLREMLPDPSVLVDMDRAAARIAAAVAAGEPCGVFGDYDVDGTCGAAILKNYFKAIGASLDVYLPDRILEGYGPTIEAFRTLKNGGARVVITVDCGVAAHQAIAAAADEGLDIIVLDHHQLDGPPPAGAYASVNPHRVDDHSGLTDLSAAGVVFMAIVAINRALRRAGWFADRTEPDLRLFLDLAALGLVCDVMPMRGLARVITAQGLKVLDGNGNPGLKALGASAGLKSPASAYDLGFLLGPRINAAGRIGHARLALDLLTTDDDEARAKLAERLHRMNAERQKIESEVQAAAIAQVETLGRARAAAVVAAGEGWHPGVVGIVAGRLKDRYDRPAIVIGVDGAIGKGSARSLPGVDIGAAIRSARAAGLLLAGGGHAAAAGLTIRADRVADLATFLEETCREDVERALSDRRLTVDGVIGLTAVSGALVRMIAGAGPFGPENPEPLFVVPSVRVRGVRTVGVGHVACEIGDDAGERVRAVAFRAVGEPLGAMLIEGRRLHLAGRIKADGWRGNAAAEFHIVDAAPAESAG